MENLATDRAKYVLTWMTVGADQDDFRAPKGEKTFEGSPISSDTILILPRAHMMRYSQALRLADTSHTLWKAVIAKRALSLGPYL